MRPKAPFDVLSQLAALRRYARSLTRDESDAEDLVHDTLVRAYEKRDSFAGERSLRVWLMTILHNVFVDGHRARKVEDRRAAALAGLHEEAAAAPQEAHVRLADVQRAFMTLPEEQRAALHLVVVEGLSYGEAARALGIPPGTLMSRLSRARAALRAGEDGAAAARGHLRIVGGAIVGGTDE